MIDQLNFQNNLPENLWNKCVNALESSLLSEIRQALQDLQSFFEDQTIKTLRIGIVRTFTIETQTDALKLSLYLLGFDSEIRVGNLNNIEQELLDSNSELLKWCPDIIFILWRIDELIPLKTFKLGSSEDENKDQIFMAKKRISSLTTGYLRNINIPLFLSTLPVTKGNELLDIHSNCGIRQAIDELNLTIRGIASDEQQINIFDFAGWAAECGASVFDRKMDFFANQPLSADAIGSFAFFFARTLRPMIQPSAKVLALDLDNVLWGGTLGEDEISALKISNDFPGNIYKKIQQKALSLKDSGVLLILLSKNNLNEVKEAFSKLDMSLELEDFVDIRVNWKEKYLNIKEIAENLKLGLDSFLFVDDQAFEREQMKFNLPYVKVLQITDDPLNILNSIENCWLFDSYRKSSEDFLRNRDYKMQSKRKSLENLSITPEEFLKTLKLVTHITAVNENNIGRVVQMLAKTNQFNLTTRRHSESKIRELLLDSRNILLTISVSDRFGDQGIVGLIIAFADGTNIHVDSFLMSCRAIGRGIEKAIWAHFVKKASEKGFINICAEYIRTLKNTQVSNLFDDLGMRRSKQDDGRCFYEAQYPFNYEFPSWIKIVEVL
jgi:FkbH-like protein